MAIRYAVALVLLALVAYGGVKAFPLISGPRIMLSSPVPGQSFPEGTVLIQGVAKHTEKLSFDGAPLLIDEHGAFSTTLTLPSGGAILSLQATDRFGRSHAVSRSLFIP